MATPTFRDGLDFFPKAIATPDFQSKGVLFGTDPSARNCHWAVVDPRKHKLTVWQKGLPDYVDSARAMNATVITNGPFIKYGGKSADISSFDKAVVWGLDKLDSFPHGSAVTSAVISWTRSKCLEDFKKSSPTGWIVGRRVNDIQNSAPNGWFFGRKGESYSEYTIAKGDPARQQEAIGGLVPSVDDFKPSWVDGVTSNTYCHWGLAPLYGDTSKIHAGASSKEAIDKYMKGMGLTEAVDNSGGVAFCVAYSGKCIDTTIAKLGVRYAVRLDGSDSVVFGSGKSLQWGDGMVSYKRASQQWGLAFVPV